MRGKAKFSKGTENALGITPAYAGKSTVGQVDVDSFGDHPRVCGEKDFYVNDHGASEGSPPRMRGKVFFKLPEIF